ncbi:GTP pyrophosphokinase family protein [Pediococcus ethanolidurans]|uniref:GTP pyrophosphokinase n=1 Tax=Pediococcus ethanolidurans TaxID=319653 RepID=UPI0029535EF9|nr:GTP pyrophosphokinase family protein [Pediococcus ethanolidurans]MDV7718452.1 GTP pyrophosphokinase family protein [Pediococcus ethanolidurans]
MILERRNFMNFDKLGQNIKRPEDVPNIKNLRKLGNLYQLGEAGANEIGTKLENLDSEFQVNYDHNPIHHMEERMKDVQSLVEKVHRKGYEMTIENIEEHIFDIAGIRVITNYIDDVYLIEKLLVNQSDVTLIKRKDYIKNPKPSGYRSLHVVVSVPVFQSTGSKNVNVEIQIRTVGMDMWASLEHKLRYKTDIDDKLVAQYGENLRGYADELSGIEHKMQGIYKKLNNYDA